MDRTEELNKIVGVFKSVPSNEDANKENELKRENGHFSNFTKLSLKVANSMNGNEALVKKMEKLTTMKEFSNDPTSAMQEISDIFQSRINFIQKDLSMLKQESERNKQGQQASQHQQFILQYLNKILSGHVLAFKNAVTLHSQHVEQRKKRVTKYGQGFDQVKAGSSGLVDTQKYAMFQKPPIVNTSVSNDQATGVSNQPALRHRRNIPPNQPGKELNDDSNKKYKSYSYLNGPGSSSNSGSNSMGFSMLQQQQKPKIKEDFRLKAAEKAEASIRQMGQLFSQMATLVSEQSETIQRIEDDVEAGLQDTQQAHNSLQQVYDITKGNRSMIFKIFALLVFFILLFLVWT